MNLKWSLLLFGLNILDDSLAALYVRMIAQGEALWAALLSGALCLLVAVSVKSYVHDRRYLLPIVLGSMIGCWLGVTFRF